VCVCPVTIFVPRSTIVNSPYNFQNQILYTRKIEFPGHVVPLW